VPVLFELCDYFLIMLLLISSAYPLEFCLVGSRIIGLMLVGEALNWLCYKGSVPSLSFAPAAVFGTGLGAFTNGSMRHDLHLLY
jgi:hypothetical protein